jgi:hypothetical protein
MTTIKELKRNLFKIGFPYRVLNNLNKKELEYLLRHSGKGSGLFDEFDKLYPIKKPFQVASNVIRSALKKEGVPNVRELQYGELHPTLWNPTAINRKTGKRTGAWEPANFMGPFTKINDPAVRNFPGYNCSDEAAKFHDIAYNDISKEPNEYLREKKIREADEILKDRLRRCPNDEMLKWAGLAGMNTKTFLEDNVGKKAISFALGKDYFGRK